MEGNFIQKTNESRMQITQDTLECPTMKRQENIFQNKKRLHENNDNPIKPVKYNIHKTGHTSVRIMNSQLSNRKIMNQLNLKTSGSIERKPLLTNSYNVPGYKK